MKVLSFLCLCLCGCLSAAFAQSKVKLDQRASVVFPGKTQEMQGATGPITFSTLDKEQKVTGMATVIDATQFGVDSSTIAANYNNSGFVDLILQGLLGQYPGVEIVSRKKIAKGSQMGYELVLQKDKPDQSVPYKNLYAQVYFAGANIYALTVLAEEGADASKEKEQFFSSLKID